MGPRTPGSTADGREPGATSSDEPAHVLSAAPGRHRNDPASVAPQPAPGAGTGSTGIHGPADRESRGAERARHGEQPTPPLPQTGRSVARRLPAGLPPGDVRITPAV